MLSGDERLLLDHQNQLEALRSEVRSEPRFAEVLSPDEARLSDVKEALAAISSDTPDAEVDELLRLRAVLELKLERRRAELAQEATSEEAQRRAGNRAMQERRWDEQAGGRQRKADEARVADLQRLIADPNQPALTDAQKDYLRGQGVA